MEPGPDLAGGWVKVLFALQQQSVRPALSLFWCSSLSEMAKMRPVSFTYPLLKLVPPLQDGLALFGHRLLKLARVQCLGLGCLHPLDSLALILWWHGFDNAQANQALGLLFFPQ